MIKTKSTSKFEKRGSLEKLASRESSVGRYSKADEFSDKKMSNLQFDSRMRSLKSEYIGNNKKNPFNVRQTLESNFYLI